ncbi:alpha/beta fold hydrolase [Mucilaginibacter sp. FT3.2]|uniref:alpha/beta fold hydrolase n=1 Tax=Mucilaginibacter sp. FT3.2 TaxID=2723090 RepID=UPI00161FA799|nr:alpha/beta hydrolase [Mucilaginibacter sp. FT3.2]MBB6233139.1 pimeloyl-ACP methyl ester carboxylesterase [Mucilaginibacter sp. FT3.2]
MGFLQLPGLGKVHFHEYGAGPKPMLAFHGYGMTGKQFHVLEQSILPNYHIYGFDHFFHGQSSLEGWTDKQITAGMPREMVRGYMQEWFNIYGEQRISILGYSIGANLALILVEEYPHLIDEVILMAPDGLSVHKIFHFLQFNFLGKSIFSLATKSSWLAPFIVKAAKKVGIIDDSLYQIAYSELDTKSKRLDAYYTVNLIKLLKPDVEKVASLINEYKIKCTLIFGKHDHLFPKSAAMPFIGMLDDAEVHELKLGHWLVIKALDEYLTR